MDDRLEFDIGLEHFDLLSADESDRLRQFNDTDKSYRANVTVADLFAERVSLHPERVAVIDGEQRITYRELDARSDQIAWLLQRRIGEARGRLAAVMMDRSVDFVAALLAIFKNGMGYVPIDPHYPRSRIEYLLQDSACPVLITEETHLASWTGAPPIGAASMICLDQAEIREEAGRLPTAAFVSLGQEDDIAYVIYTSGSTGQPKGVTITHKQLLNTLFWLGDQFPLTETDIIAQKTSISFTDSVWELFWPLISGASLSVMEERVGKSPALLFEWLGRERITFTQFVPAMMRQFLSYVESNDEVDPLPALQWVFNGGEAISADLVQDWNRLFGRARIANIYGMTESAIYASVYLCRDAPLDRGDNIPVGVPISNTRIYVLGQSGEVCPPGVKGELCIGGTGITEGYLGKPDLTERAFTVHPATGERLYRTGDIGCLDEQYRLEYWGRKDDQVQIRGYRVELKEVERAILQHPEVRQTAVLTISVGEMTELVSYYICDNLPVAPVELRAHLEAVLPAYMVPGFFVELSEMPLTPHGKIDRRALPEPGAVRHASSSYTAPRDERERRLAQIWSEVLQVSSPGIDDNFIEYGGHSLQAVRFAAAVERQLGIKLGVQSLLEHQTIRALSESMASGTEQPRLPDPKLLAWASDYAVSPFQEQIYMLRELEGEETSSNSPGALRLEGPLDTDKLDRVLQELVSRHESLRSSFHKIHGEVRQVLHQEALLHIETIELEGRQPDQAIHAFIRPFALDQAPLFRAGILRLDADDHLLLIDMHHIISDALSKATLLREFAQLYDGARLPAVTMQPKEYAAWIREYEQSTSWKREESYWLDVYKQLPQPLGLPTDHERGSTRADTGRELQAWMAEDLVSRLRQFNREHKLTLYMSLLAAYSILLSKYANQDDLVIGCDLDRRVRPEFYGSIGAFTNLVALRMKPSKQMTVIEYLTRIKSHVSLALEHGDYPFERLLQRLYERHNLSMPIVETMLTLHQPEPIESSSASLHLSSYPLERQSAMVGLALEALDTEQGLLLNWLYHARLFEAPTIGRMNDDLAAVIVQMMDRPDAQISQLELRHGLALATTEWEAGGFAL
ncbi:non-ribosomal peptide synthetase [Paenibacillus sp. 598K]|uniref:non-ribosomal peptide synthetase n=1 Tax=Paenibacillus sp. 598K TaxID=1117987 RepID=UPI000FFEF4BE|nr:non-ribosomal peptide synthetase [Paenibacillus sp. 598K]